MSTGEHDEFRRDLGVYVLGALEPAERDRLERHLAGCETCRDEVAHLAVLPGLLTRVGADAAVDVPTPPVGPVVARIAELRRRSRRRTRWLTAGAAVAAGVAAVVALTLLPTPGGATAVAFRDDAATAEATVEERAWGMAVHIDARELPRRDGYYAMAVTPDGHRTQVASWSDTGGPVSVTGSCYLEPGEVAALEIVSARDDAVLTVLRPQS